ncbi:hypothetical protein P0082_06035 [Candidatus Haliotispira prima]|uniref:Uncharacterized protein n=1 Tax=Candidatus Haliotispira prima TaxID=3034016 RepID=A0ABY8MFB1_9SPIO|nr:hypothetical protein P0082_06035 [Candidatus Haliotispira prima]
MASSVQLEVTGIPAITDAGSIIRLAAEAVPTKAEAQASPGYVSLSIEAGSTRKFSISQHYTTNLGDGLTLADVLTPNTKYKLYLFMPAAIDLGQTTIAGGEIAEDRVEISFTTASLPPAGDAVWNEEWTARKYVASLNEYHFMQAQTGITVSYFQTPFTLILHEASVEVSDSSTFDTVGTYTPSGGAAPAALFNYNYGTITGYTSDYNYFIDADKLSIIEVRLQSAHTSFFGNTSTFFAPISRY